MHAYTVTSKPGRVRRAARRVWACLLHCAAVALCLLLGAVVLAIRIVRVAATVLAKLAIRCEVEAAIRTGMPPLASILGVRLTEAMRDEFTAGWRDATDTTTTEGAHR